MKILSILFVYLLIGSTVYSQNLNWVNDMDGAGEITPHAITTDLQGNVIMVGEFKGTIDFDPSSNVFSLSSQDSLMWNSFIHKVDSNGKLIWAKSLSSLGSNYLFDVTTDKNGNLFVTGFFYESFDIDLGSGTTLYPGHSIIGNAMMIMKLDSTGSTVWVKSKQGTSTLSRIFARSILVNDSNEIFVAGNFEGTIDLNPDDSSSNMVMSSSLDDSYCMKLDSIGNLIWFKGIDKAGDSYDMTIDSEGNLYLVSNYSLAIIITKLNRVGDFQWEKWIGTSGGRCRSYSIVSNEKGNIYIAGYFTGTLKPGQGQSSPTVINETPFVYKLDTAGTLVWHWVPERLQPGGGGYYPKLCIDTAGDIYVACWFSGTYDFDPSLDTLIIKSKVLSDFFVMQLFENGELGWVTAIGDSGRDESTVICIDLNSNVHVAGTFDGVNSDFDPGNCEARVSAPNGGVFELKLSPHDPRLIVKNLDTISSNANGAIRFQWLDCDNNYSPVGVGDTLATFIPSSNGNYAVSYSLNGCKDTSDCFFVGDVGLVQNHAGTLNLYPNPTNGAVLIEMDEFHYDKLSYRLYDGIGKLVLKREFFDSNEELNIEIPGPSGIYFLELLLDNKDIYRTTILKD